MGAGPRRSRPCVYGCQGPARLWPQGWRCVEHAPAAQPAPPPGTTYVERMAAADARPKTYSALIEVERERRRRIRAEADAW